MIKQATVSTIMSKNIIALTRTDNLERAEMLFNKFRIKHIPVVSRDVVIGMLSYTDLLRASLADATQDTYSINAVVCNSFSVEQVMTKDVETISSETTIIKATEILANRGFHSLPVVDNGVLTGIVTTTDLLNYYLKQCY